MIARIPVIATVLVGLAAAVLAATATADVAVASGAVSAPAFGWLVPMCVEGTAVTAGVLAWQRTAHGVSAGPERLALTALIALAVIVNASHGGPRPLGMVLAAVPPLVLLLSVEMLLRMIAVSAHGDESAQPGVGAQAAETAATVRSAASTNVATSELSNQPELGAPAVAAVSSPRPMTVRVNSDAPANTVTVPAGPLTREERARLVEQMYRENPKIKGTAIAEAFNLGESTGRRLRAAAEAKVKAEG